MFKNVSNIPDGAAPVTRRQLVEVAGVALVGVSLVGATGCASPMAALGLPAFPHVETGPVATTTVAGVPIGSLNGGTKPIFVAPAGSLDPVAHSVADTLFWGDR